MVWQCVYGPSMLRLCMLLVSSSQVKTPNTLSADLRTAENGSFVGLTEETAAALNAEQAHKLQVGSKALFVAWLSYTTLIWSMKGALLCFYSRLTYAQLLLFLKTDADMDLDLDFGKENLSRLWELSPLLVTLPVSSLF